MYRKKVTENIETQNGHGGIAWTARILNAVLILFEELRIKLVAPKALGLSISMSNSKSLDKKLTSQRSENRFSEKNRIEFILASK